VFLDNARYHHARLLGEWMDQPGRRIKLHFIPPYCPHLNTIERLWGVMHKHITHNTCYETGKLFAEALIMFLREKIPMLWENFRDSITDNFRIISRDDFRVIKLTEYNTELKHNRIKKARMRSTQARFFLNRDPY
jgi:DDE superfamily endonuclease